MRCAKFAIVCPTLFPARQAATDLIAPENVTTIPHQIEAVTRDNLFSKCPYLGFSPQTPVEFLETTESAELLVDPLDCLSEEKRELCDQIFDAILRDPLLSESKPDHHFYSTTIWQDNQGDHNSRTNEARWDPTRNLIFSDQKTAR